MFFLISLLFTVTIYIYIQLRLKNERKFSELPYSTSHIKQKIINEYTGNIICVTDYHILRNTSSLKAIYYMLCKFQNTLIFKVPENESDPDFDASVFQKLKLSHVPSILYVIKGKATDKFVFFDSIEGPDAIRKVNNYISIEK